MCVLSLPCVSPGGIVRINSNSTLFLGSVLGLSDGFLERLK